jgi:hypothetical protein
MSKFLACGAEQDFVDVDIVRLFDRKGDAARERVGRNGLAFIEFLDVRCRNVARQSVATPRAHFSMVVTSLVIARASSAFSSAQRPG